MLLCTGSKPSLNTPCFSLLSPLLPLTFKGWHFHSYFKVVIHFLGVLQNLFVDDSKIFIGTHGLSWGIFSSLNWKHLKTCLTLRHDLPSWSPQISLILAPVPPSQFNNRIVRFINHQLFLHSCSLTRHHMLLFLWYNYTRANHLIWALGHRGALHYNSPQIPPSHHLSINRFILHLRS